MSAGFTLRILWVAWGWVHPGGCTRSRPTYQLCWLNNQVPQPNMDWIGQREGGRGRGGRGGGGSGRSVRYARLGPSRQSSCRSLPRAEAEGAFGNNWVGRGWRDVGGTHSAPFEERWQPAVPGGWLLTLRRPRILFAECPSLFQNNLPSQRQARNYRTISTGLIYKNCKNDQGQPHTS